MQPEERDAAYVWDMLDAAKTAVELAEGLEYHHYSQDRKLQLAIERLVEIMGEAARNVSNSFREIHPEIPWRKIIGQRNVLAHDYGDIKHEKMWLLVEKYIPDLISKLEPLLPPPPVNETE